MKEETRVKLLGDFLSVEEKLEDVVSGLQSIQRITDSMNNAFENL